jgi:predicted transcriptional regulator
MSDPGWVAEFQAVFNEIHDALCRFTGKQSGTPFHRVMTIYAGRTADWDREAMFLDRARQLRNVLAHDPLEAGGYAAVPTPGFLARLVEIRDDLLSAPTVGALFGKPVLALQGESSLVEVLSLIAENDFSQFPVFEGAEYLGLLTENGITRWLAHRVGDGKLSVRLDQARARDLIREQEVSDVACFVRPMLTLRELRWMFTGHHLLEAVLITEEGQPSTRLLGIATRWDLLRRASRE